MLGLASSGLHSNGYSLARKVVFDIAGLAVDDDVDELGETVGEALIRPTRIYVRPLRRVLGYYKVKSVVHGIAHITGGGLRENLERILPDGRAGGHRAARLAGAAGLSLAAAAGRNRRRRNGPVFNMGVGLVLVVSPYYADSIRHQLADSGVESWPIGRIEAGQRGVDLGVGR